MDLDAPVEPIDPEEDRRRTARAIAAERRSALSLIATLAHPLATLAGGFVLGSWHADAPVVGAVGMMLAWIGARAVLWVAASVAMAVEAPSLLRRLFGRAGDVRDQPAPFRRSAKAVLAVHAAGFAALAALAGIAAGLMGPGSLNAVDVVAFAVLGLALGVATAWTEPA